MGTRRLPLSPFYFGAAQLIGQSNILPESVHDDTILENRSDDYLYLDAIKFIKEVKSGSPFAETSPMLNDISALPCLIITATTACILVSALLSWEKIIGDMPKQYEGELSKKLPAGPFRCSRPRNGAKPSRSTTTAECTRR